MSLFQLYLFMVILPNIHSTLGSLSIVALIIFLAISVVLTISKAGALEDRGCSSVSQGLKNPWRIAAVVMIVVGALSIISPSDRQIYMVAGGYAATNTKDVEKLPENIVKAANNWLEKLANLNEEPKTKSKEK